MLDQVIHVLVLVTLIEMMIAIGLGVTLADLATVARNGRLVVGALVANYVCVPALTVALLLVFNPLPAVALGFLILAVCPGAPFGPPATRIARGDTTISVGLMVILAASSAIVAPPLLHLLLLAMPAGPTQEGSEAAQVDVVKILSTLLVSQLLPLGVGLGVRHRWPALAQKLQRPANALSSILSVVLLVLVFAVHFGTLREIRLFGFLGMLILLAGTVVAGWFLGGPTTASRRATALTTSLRNVGVGLVIATGTDPDSAAVTAVIAYGLIEIVGSLLLAIAWGRAGGARILSGDRIPIHGTWRETGTS